MEKALDSISSSVVGHSDIRLLVSLGQVNGSAVKFCCLKARIICKKMPA
jgi:hypothetical protein